MRPPSSEFADNIGLPNHELIEIERTAAELARVAGAEIQTAFGGMLAVKYKDGAAMAWRDPVSEVDSKVESLIRARLEQQFSEHDILGEEFDERPGRDHDIVCRGLRFRKMAKLPVLPPRAGSPIASARWKQSARKPNV